MLPKSKNKRAIALLLTIFFIMLITMSLGVGLKYINSSSKSMQNESLMLQSRVIVDDFLKILKTSPDLAAVKDADTLAIFLAQSSLLPFESNDIKVLIQISSARSKIDPNILLDKPKMELFKSFLINNMINVEYADILSDAVGGIKEDGLYNTDLFTDYPDLFRDYLTSINHLKKVNEIYRNKYHDNSIDAVDFTELFYMSNEHNRTIDLNYATPLAWEYMIGCDKIRAESIVEGSGTYRSVQDILLSDEEKISLSKFKVSFFEPIVNVKMSINKKNENAVIIFEYNITSKKGSNFVFKV